MTYIELFLLTQDKYKGLVKDFTKTVEPAIEKLVKKYGEKDVRMILEAYPATWELGKKRSQSDERGMTNP